MEFKVSFPILEFAMIFIEGDSSKGGKMLVFVIVVVFGSDVLFKLSTEILLSFKSKLLL